MLCPCVLALVTVCIICCVRQYGIVLADSKRELRRWLYANGLDIMWDAVAAMLPSRHLPIQSLNSVHVCGERNTGTNFVEQLLNKRTGAAVCVPENQDYINLIQPCSYSATLRMCHEHQERNKLNAGAWKSQHRWWKHDFAPRLSRDQTRKTLVVYMLRDPADWLASIRKRPYELEPSISNLTLPKLLDQRVPLTMEQNAPDGRLARSKFILREILKHDGATAASRFTLLELRALKFESYMRYAHNGHPCVFVNLRYVQTHTDDVIRLLAAAARVSLVYPDAQVRHTKTGKHFTATSQSPEVPTAKVDEAITRQQLRGHEDVMANIKLQYWNEGRVVYEAA